MSSIQYNPNPTRVWSRVQNRCSTDTASSTVDYARIDYDRQMLLKGNILQYKKNSSNLTKNQRYTQIAKGMWTNRTKTWATQSETYTNPNNSSLLRVNNTILDPSNNSFSSRSNPFNCPTTEIPDGGNLVCNVVVDPCTQEVIKRTLSQQLCNPTTDSDVPGQIQQLCWNDGTQTWYPRQRYTMGNSGTSWPEGYKGFVSAIIFVGPVLSVGDVGCSLNIPLSWTFLDSTCAPITSFNIYENDVLILNVPVEQTSITINKTVAGTYMFYVTSVINTLESEKSNNVFVSTEKNYYATGVFYTYEKDGFTFLNFTDNGTITFTCYPTNIVYTLVGGGASGGDCGNSSHGGAAGGGGQVITKTTTVITNDTWNITIGKGGTNPPGSTPGGIGGDTIINSSSYNDGTDNSTYSGGGGGGNTSYNIYAGGGGPGNSTTSSPGGNYNISYSYGTGGASGSLTGDLFTIGNIGGNNSSSIAGNGGDGIQGIDNNYYGGGGGGGGFGNYNTGGKGGKGGGGNGIYFSSDKIPSSGSNNTGGGGGASDVNNNPGNGGSGIAIFKI